MNTIVLGAGLIGAPMAIDLVRDSGFAVSVADMSSHVLQVIVEGAKSEQRIRYKYGLVDRYDAETDTSSMARTTGYAATLAVRLLANGMYSRKGLSVPEYLCHSRVHGRRDLYPCFDSPGLRGGKSHIFSIYTGL